MRCHELVFARARARLLLLALAAGVAELRCQILLALLALHHDLLKGLLELVLGRFSIGQSALEQHVPFRKFLHLLAQLLELRVGCRVEVGHGALRNFG